MKECLVVSKICCSVIVNYFTWTFIQTAGNAPGSISTSGSTSDIMGVRDFFFGAETQPLGPGSQMCLNISINDDSFLEPIEIFSICGTSQQNAVIILNGGCTNIIIRDNEGTHCNDCSGT